ncbi:MULTISPECIES: terminase large subunit domain-containing protein [unclassified Pantoea]|uniref:terminase large subunit domain-containing protein n=1 Tax=unclassified Pantoea TaxID=2630326 RepID=UPI001232D228|nr:MULTISPECIES: terminase family protein [unclassified Pantoea]KAA5952105.1 oxidoreductase [Pantoea sp. VH_24]KAA5953458.1 oxidoreductase [Pantoea sp. VH_16]KAA5961696.1 oxidoreductase [Pantoea sp. VH_18]KAA5993401.1 oxidoreductase [Pantoea sp. M_1]KAA5998168.1 oxidoreductase [Pantoea sp. F_7]
MENTDLKSQAKNLYWMGRDMRAISQSLGININTLYSWRRRDKWDEISLAGRAHDRALVRWLELNNKPADELTARDFKVMDFYSRQIARFERALQRQDDGERKKKKGPKNFLSPEQIDALRQNALDTFYDYQLGWLKQRELGQRIRMILKSRQVGASWYFAREALLDALDSGRNQIFLSASRNQALNFKRFIQRWVKEVCDVELTGGNEMVLANGATLYFLGTSAATAQSYTGNLYFDEFFWVNNFLKLRKVAAGMATHDKAGLTLTYFSTPSSEEHEAYKFWTGDLYNSHRPRDKRVDIPLTHDALQHGLLCDDGAWRQILTIKDAIEKGLDQVTLSTIENETPPDDFLNLYMCQFVARGQRAFDYNSLIRCGIDGVDEWGDWRPDAPSPMGDREVWLGYDPNGSSGNGDSAGLVAVVPPSVPGGKFRVIEIMQIQGLPFEAQAEVIRQFTLRYNVTHIGIDGTGVGESVGNLVKNFFPAAVVHNYSVSLKRALVMKAQMLIRGGRFEYDAGLLDLVSAFMTIRRVVTPGGVMTYESDRARGSNHGDLAWATMHALINEPIGAEMAAEGGVWEF